MSPPLPFQEPVYVTIPILPELASFVPLLEQIWQRHWLTNKGPMHDKLEEALCNYLGATHLSLVNNATMALLLASRGLNLSGEVITSPFTFPATPSSLTWSGITPVFADIDPVTMTLDPEAVERAITPATTGILGVHVYGIPCDVHALQAIGGRHHLRIVYDGAHAFGTQIDGVPISNFGDATIFSFHATKLFHTAEGGAVATRTRDLKENLDLLKNFGIRDEVTVSLPGINGKITELQAALGISMLEIIGKERAARAEIGEVYIARLKRLEGITCVVAPQNVRRSHQYFVIRVKRTAAGATRTVLYEKLKAFNVFTRRYFYPLCSEYKFYKELPSSRRENLKIAHAVADEVLCLPYYGALGVIGAERICDMIEHIALS
jgi:dTDP-4-amino-4,6-dideoxygalactose transaminase